MCFRDNPRCPYKCHCDDGDECDVAGNCMNEQCEIGPEKIAKAQHFRVSRYFHIHQDASGTHYKLMLDCTLSCNEHSTLHYISNNVCMFLVSFKILSNAHNAVDKVML